MSPAAAGTATSAPFSPRFARRTASLKPSAIREILKTTESPRVISFAGGLPAPELFPLLDTAEAAREVFEQDGPAALQYGITEGHRPLREWVCAHLEATVGLRATPDEVLITHGSQQGLDLVAKVLLDPGDTVLVENPAYLGALQAFQSYEADIVGLSADDEGVRIAELRQALEVPVARRPKLLYLIPNFQNPTGTSTSPARRAQLIALAAEFNVPVLEDDPYGPLRYRGEAPPALAAHPGARDCLYLGTSSKILAPGLRVAWLVVPDRAFHERLVTAKQATDLHTSTFAQRLVWRYLREPGRLEAHLARLNTVYSRRRDTMLAALGRHLGGRCTWTDPDGGLFLWATLPDTIDTVELLKAAAAQDVAFVPGAPFWVGGAVHNTLRLNFSNASEERIDEGIARLGTVLDAALSARRASA